jgi:predicted lipoprotein
MKLRQFTVPMIAGMALLHVAMAAMATEASNTTAGVPEPAWAQAWLDTGYLPRHQALTHAAEQLADSTAVLCAAPDTAKLTQARAAWLATSTAWRALDGAPAGPMVLARLGRKIDFRPVRVAELEAAIQGGERNVAAQGLAAAEYLLWGDAQPKSILATLKNPARCGYLVQIAKDIDTETHTLDEGWQIYRNELAAENPFFRQNMFSEHVNLMLASLTGLAKRMPTADMVKAEQFAEWRSNSAKAQLLAQLGGLANAMQGVTRQLSENGQPALARAMQNDLSAAQNQCGKLPDALDKAAAKARTDCHKAIVQIKKRLQDEIAEQLDLSLGFTEGDGD